MRLVSIGLIVSALCVAAPGLASARDQTAVRSQAPRAAPARRQPLMEQAGASGAVSAVIREPRQRARTLARASIRTKQDDVFL